MTKRISGLLFGLIYLAVFVGSLALYTRNIERPAIFHSAEPGKVELVQKQINRFYHPLLMTNTLRAAAHLGGAETPRQILELGRWISALFAALAVLCLMATAQLLRGRLEAVAVGVLLSTCPMVLLNAHYLKEDTALLLGMSVAALALVFHDRAPSSWRLALVGAGCALAGSGKYIGLLFTLCALPFVLAESAGGSPASRSRRLAVFLGGFAAIFLFVNIHLVFELRSFLVGVKTESVHVTSHHYGLLRARWGSFYWQQIATELGSALPILLCVTAYLVQVWRLRKEASARAERCLLLWPVVYFLVVGASQVQAPRYVLPVVIWILFAAGMGLGVIVETASRALARPGGGTGSTVEPGRARFGVALALLALAALALVNLGRCRLYLDQLARDTRMDLEEWASRSLPAEARVLAEQYAWLHVDKATERAKSAPPRIDTLLFVGDMGSVAAIRDAGYDYVVLASSAYDRYFDATVRPDAEHDFEPPEEERRLTRLEGKISYLERYRRVRGCYEEIFSELELVWSRTPAVRMDNTSSPEIRVYQVRRGATLPEARTGIGP